MLDTLYTIGYYIVHATEIDPSLRQSASATGEPDAAAISTPSRTIRQWALAEGHRIRVRGRISYAVIAAYNATH